jgi:hypothetical protein
MRCKELAPSHHLSHTHTTATGWESNRAGPARPGLGSSVCMDPTRVVVRVACGEASAAVHGVVVVVLLLAETSMGPAGAGR